MAANLEMGAEREIITKTSLPEEFFVCEACGYRDGFHVSFKKRGQAFEIFLICPNCHQRYRIGWQVGLAPSA